MILPEGLSVADCDECDSLVLHVLIEVSLDIDAHGRGALVEDSINRLVVNQTRHRHTLLLSSRKHIVPVILGVPTTFTCRQVFKLDFIENLLKLVFIDTLSSHLLLSVRVDDLISQGSLRQVRSLRYVKDLVDGGFLNAAAEYGPKLTQDAEERRLTATVGSSDKKVHARLDLEVHSLDENITIG